MKPKSTIFINQCTRQILALLLSVLVVPVAQMSLYAQEPPPAAYAPLDALQLDQLVAPVALYPDGLLAQVLTASTYPDQITDADNWSQQNAGLSPDQRASFADSMGWDPSVKALTAFPSVLDNLARNIDWASQLGDAYYNQPADVMNAVQAMRFQAQQSGVLTSTPQQRVYFDNGAIMIVAVNPGLVYVPYYNPWRIWAPTFVAYPGYYLMPPPRGLVLGVGIGFAAGIPIGLFAHYGWGYGAWAPSWHGGLVLYNHGAYYSHSVTVYNHGNFGAYNRGVFERAGGGVPGGFHPAVTRAGFGRPEAGGAGGPGARPGTRPEGPAAGRPEGAPGSGPRMTNRPAGGPGATPAFGPSGTGRPAGGSGATPAFGPSGTGRPAGGSGVTPAFGPSGTARPTGGPGTPPSSGPSGTGRPAGGSGVTPSSGPSGTGRPAGTPPAARGPASPTAPPAPRGPTGQAPAGHAAPAAGSSNAGHPAGGKPAESGGRGPDKKDDHK